MKWKSSCKRLEGPDAVGECWQDQQDVSMWGLGASGIWERTGQRQCLKHVGWRYPRPSTVFAAVQSTLEISRFSQAREWHSDLEGWCPVLHYCRKKGAGVRVSPFSERLGWRWGLIRSLFRALVVNSRGGEGRNWCYSSPLPIECRRYVSGSAFPESAWAIYLSQAAVGGRS